MLFIGLGTATPPQVYRQAEGWHAVQRSEVFDRLSARSKAILKKVLLGDNGIETRSLALSDLNEAFALNPNVLQARFAANAPRLASEAAERALADARLQAAQVDALIISTCTGYLCPGLSSYVMEQLALRSDVLAYDLVGHGCGAAIPNLELARSLLASGRVAHVLSICVEVCSAALYFDDDPGVLISACLFGDGAGAAVLSNAEAAHQRRVEWRQSRSFHSPADRDYLRFEHRNGMLRNILTRQVPDLASKYAEAVLTEVLNESGLTREQIRGWIMHAGGRDILLALRQRLGLSEQDVFSSSEILRRFGNVSSACVFFVLQHALRSRTPPGLWWMCSFGAGFSCHGALLESGPGEWGGTG